MVRLCSSIDLDDVVLIRQMIRDGAFHGTSHAPPDSMETLTACSAGVPSAFEAKLIRARNLLNLAQRHDI
jgi:hypothetical protein